MADWQKRARDAESKLARVRRLVDRNSLFGSVPCDELDDALDSEPTDSGDA